MGKTSVISWLHKMGANLDASSPEGYTPKLLAVTYGHAPVLRTLFECDVDLNVCRFDKRKIYLFLQAVERGSLDVVRAAAECGCDVHSENSKGQNAAHMAAHYCHDHIIPFLNSMRVDLDVPDKHGITPALLAVQRGHAAILKTLSHYGVDMNAGRHRESRRNLFNEAVACGDLTVMAVLVECGVDVHARCDKARDTVVHTAASKGQHHVFVELQRLGVSLESSDSAGQSPAFIAAGRGGMESLRVLRECGVDLLQIGTNGLSPLQAAKAKQRIDVVQYLEELRKPALMKQEASAKEAADSLLATLAAEDEAQATVVARQKKKKKNKNTNQVSYHVGRTVVSRVQHNNTPVARQHHGWLRPTSRPRFRLATEFCHI
jgi:ankyrin repeat protein